MAKEGPQENPAVEREQQEMAERVHSFAHPYFCLHLFHHEVTFCGGFDHAKVTSNLLGIVPADDTAGRSVDRHGNPKHGSLVHLAAVSLHEQRNDPSLFAMVSGRFGNRKRCAS